MTVQDIQEVTVSNGHKVDRENNRIRGCKILGEFSGNGRRYPAATRKKAKALYEGMKVNIDHVDPKTRRSVSDRNGFFSDIRETDDGLHADWNYNPNHVLTEQILWEAEHNPNSTIGFSHDARGNIIQQDGDAVVEEILQVRSVDLVADPATATNIFEDLNPDPKEPTMAVDLSKITLAELRESRGDLIEALMTDSKTASMLEEKTREAEALQESLDSLQTTATAAGEKIKLLEDENAVFKQERDRRTLETSIQEELDLARLDSRNKAHVSDLFMEQLQNTPDADARKKLIHDRCQLIQEASGKALESFPLCESRHSGNASHTIESDPAKRTRQWSAV